MIITQLLGGLGNQMFQYAAGRALSLSKSNELKFDPRFFTNYKLHNGCEIDRVFNVSANSASKGDLLQVLGWRSSTNILNLLQRKYFSWLRGYRFVIEPYYTYWPLISYTPDDCYLMGYWQSEKYFRHIAQTIRADFSFKKPFNIINLKISDTISRCNSISLHVRRGDYVSNPATLATHGLCSADYYHQAINYIVERVEQPVFYVFSDDIPWVKDNIIINFPCSYVEHNREDESYNDMRLTSLCRHHIIANSSFSWWGAWLNPSLDKIVVAPKKWFADKKDVRDLFPQGWVTL